jgi:parallel beta-helix repeat protein
LNNDYSFSLSYSHHNLLQKNNCSNNSNEGLWIHWSSYNSIENNIFSNNNHGIRFWASSNNTIVNNTFRSNNRLGVLVPYGISLAFSSDNNLIYHNNILNNTNQASDICINPWDNGYPSGGNYWSDYGGVDYYKGPNQDILGSDGIGDTNYTIDFDSVDNYPLIGPFSEFEIFLHHGWNLISSPFIQSNTSIISLFASIQGEYDAVQWYNATDAKDQWKHYHIGKSSQLNDLDYINHTMGFLIHITNPIGTLFRFGGIIPIQNQSIILHPGWNMVGYPSLTSYNITNGLNNVNFTTEVDAIWTFDSFNRKWEHLDEFDYFEPGKGYYIHSKIKTTWEVPL